MFLAKFLRIPSIVAYIVAGLLLGPVFGLITVSHSVEISGAFLAGVALSPFPVNALVRGQLNSLGGFFSALFFAGLGAVLTLPTPQELVQALALIGLVLILTPPLMALVAERAGFSARLMRSGSWTTIRPSWTGSGRRASR